LDCSEGLPRVFSRFFIDRPIFASVLSIITVLLGLIALGSLPVNQYPRVTPPTIIISCNYPGADAKVVAEAIAAPIEQQVNGVEGMLYMTSQCGNDGSYSLTVAFEPEVNQSFAQVLVQNRVNLALPLLPDVVKQTGITTRKRSGDLLMFININSPDSRYDQLYLSNFVTLKIREELARLEGVAEVGMLGQKDYCMRIWLDPERLAARNLTASDVISALREQNTQVAAGQIGRPPARPGQVFELTLSTLGRLSEPEQFEQIIIRATPEGRVRLKDVGRVELGARNHDITAQIDGYPCVSVSVTQLPDANALETAQRVIAKMRELESLFPPGIRYHVSYDTTLVIRESIRKVFHTLRDAIVLVAVVVLLFLQNWRSALIPLVAVPVSLVGTFAVMAVLGFSLNNLTLFGLVLAIGIVVDDAIVVVEAVEHHLERGLAPREAAERAMQDVSGPVIAVALVLTAVFIPCTFIGGISGQFFRQFALTIAVSTAISAFNSLTLSPALAALLLQPRGARKDWLGRVLDFGLGWLFRAFEWSFRQSQAKYLLVVGWLLRRGGVALILYVGLIALTAYWYARTPAGYLPAQDRGNLFVPIQLPDAASLERTQKVVDQVAQIIREVPGVAHTTGIAGASFTLGANGSNFGQVFVALKPFDERTRPELSARVIAEQIRQRVEREIVEATVLVLTPPPIPGLGNAGGFTFILEDRGDWGLEELQKQSRNLIAKASKLPELQKVFTVFRADSPQLFVDVNRDQCARMGVEIDEVFQTLQTFLGSRYVNDFNRFGRTWQVVVQSEPQFRRRIEDIRRLRVRNREGGMVPLGAVTTVRAINGPLLLTRYNMYPAVVISGSAVAGVSSGQAMQLMEQLAQRELPEKMAYEWTALSLIQQRSGNTGVIMFLLAVVLVFLVLAAQYESWTLPLAVIVVVPTCLVGSIGAVHWTGGDLNIFTQIGLVVLVGLVSKNAVLIVEYGKAQRQMGLPRWEATLAACRLRFRPIVMTSLAFTLGVVPLIWASGAGAEMRQALGLPVFGGMLGVTVFGLLFTPVFFYWLNRDSHRVEPHRVEPPTPLPAAPPAPVTMTAQPEGEPTLPAAPTAEPAPPAAPPAPAGLPASASVADAAVLPALAKEGQAPTTS
jgi:multidrug efflux pump